MTDSETSAVESTYDDGDQSRARQQAVQKQRLSPEVDISKVVTSDAFVPLADARGSDYWASGYITLLFQLIRFGLVGLTAAGIHFSIVVMLVQHFALEPLVANAFAFLISFQVGYFGHRRFTFTGTTTLHTVAFPKLLTLQIFNFMANESLFYFFLSLHIPYQLALLLVLSILPLFTFTVSKLWIFR